MLFQRRLFFQVTLPALVISLSLGGVCWLGIRSLNHLQADRLRLAANDLTGLMATQEAQLRLRQIRVHALLYAMEPTERRKAILDTDHLQFEAALESANAAADDEQERHLLQEMEQSYRRYRVEIDLISKRPVAGASVADFVAWADAHPIGPLLSKGDEVIQLNRQSMTEMARENDELTSQTRRTMLLLGILGPLAGLVGGMGVAWGMSRSFTQLRLLIRDTNDQLEREIGSVRVLAVGDHHQLAAQMELVSARVGAVVEQLQQQRREISRAEQLAAVGQLAAGVAHEIRNPLTGIKILIEAALLPNGPHRLTSEEMIMMLGQIRRVERTVRGLLECARPTSADRQLTDLGGLARVAIESALPLARERRVELTADLSPTAVPVMVDTDQTLSLLGNLLLNAIEATPQGGTVRISLGTAVNQRATLVVWDGGPGIDAEISERLFSPFVTGKHNGTGLGLFIARRIAEDHGGTLAGENAPTWGARFTLTLPVSEPDDAQIAGRR